jgi:hypothetical protein
MSETEETAEAVAEDVAAPEETVAEAVEVASEQDEPAAVAEEPVAEEAVAVEEPLAEEAIVVEAPAGVRQARILLCERGHRTAAIWSEPTVCHARPTRSGPECGRQLYPIGELPEQVQKALNPLKASKKASKG